MYIPIWEYSSREAGFYATRARNSLRAAGYGIGEKKED
jgi:hypothetical protein